VSYDHITTDRHLAEFCRELADAPRVAFDTEFVSEDTYRPQLCLIQVAARERLAVIDTLTIDDLTPFWNLIAKPGQDTTGYQTIVHAGREEMLFCLQGVGHRPANLFDIQIASGLIGLEYPAGYGSLMYKLLGARSQKGETRTDWRKRPLSDRQIEYALDDVRYLEAMRNKLENRLTELGRLGWLADEMSAWQSDVEATRSRERWWKTSGISGLSQRSLAIVRELWRWRETESERRNSPPRRVLRDDLLVELAKRRTADPKQIRAVRGLERGDLQRALPRIVDAIERALALPDSECPQTTYREMPPQVTMLGQFLSSALSSICREADLAPSIVGTASDVRDLIAYRLEMAGTNGNEPPALGRGWRAEVVGHVIDDLLNGRTSIRIRDPLSEEPLAFDPVK